MRNGQPTDSWLNRLLVASRRLFPNQCLLCSAPGLESDLLCTACQMALPHLTGPSCSSCALPLNTESDYCGRCLAEPPAFSRSFIPFIYAYPLDTLIHRFKYSGKMTEGRNLSEMLAGFLAHSYQENQLALPEWVIPVPMHWTRRFRRGFNQAEILAQSLSRLLGVPHHHRLCRRQRRTPPQSGLDGKQRQRNLRHAFSLQPDAQRQLTGRCVALVDDVVTTTSTTKALARLLVNQGGAEEVHVWALARTPYMDDEDSAPKSGPLSLQ